MVQSIIPGSIFYGLGMFGYLGYSQVQLMETSIGRPFDFTMKYVDDSSWSAFELAFPSSLSPGDGTVRRIILSVPLQIPSIGYNIHNAAVGYNNVHYQAFANVIKANRSKIFSLRVGWEMNINGWSWSTTHPGLYVQAYRNFATIMRATDHTVPLDWCPHIGPAQMGHLMEEYYPGDDVVDSVGLDWYQSDLNHLAGGGFGNLLTWGGQGYGLDWLDTFAAKHKKLISFGEYEGSNNDATVLSQFIDWMDTRQGRIAYHSYWNGPDGTGGSSTGEFENAPNIKALYVSRYSGTHYNGKY